MGCTSSHLGKTDLSALLSFGATCGSGHLRFTSYPACLSFTFSLGSLRSAMRLTADHLSVSSLAQAPSVSPTCLSYHPRVFYLSKPPFWVHPCFPSVHSAPSQVYLSCPVCLSYPPHPSKRWLF